MKGMSMANPEPLENIGTAALRRVCIVQRIVPHYRVKFFRSLQATLASSGVELHLIHGQESPGTVPRSVALDEPWAHRIQNRYIRIARQELIWQPCSFRELASADLVIVEHANRLLLNYPLLAARTKARRVAFWGHGTNFQAPAPHSTGAALGRNLARAADWWFAYTSGGAKLVQGYGFPRERVTVVNNAIDSGSIVKALAQVTDEGSARICARLRLERPGVAVFCGRLVEEKRLDLLWAAAQEIRRRCAHFSLLVIGDGPLESDARRMAAEHEWIHYLGAQAGDGLAPYFAVSDFMLMPGLVGLVVVDAFAAGLPLVTTRIDTHSPEIEYLEPGVNGLVTEPNAESLADACVELLQSPPLLDRLRDGCVESSRVYTLEAMVERFSAGVLEALGRAPVGADS
jgi:glycosyltransferase involved in cell wall biosynthesis